MLRDPAAAAADGRELQGARLGGFASAFQIFAQVNDQSSARSVRRRRSGGEATIFRRAAHNPSAGRGRIASPRIVQLQVSQAFLPVALCSSPA